MGKKTHEKGRNKRRLHNHILQFKSGSYNIKIIFERLSIKKGIEDSVLLKQAND